MMNVVAAAFVESVLLSSEHDKDIRIQESLERKEIAVKHLRGVFREIDQDLSGEISSEEFQDFLTDPQLRMYLESLDVTAEDSAMLFRLLDLDDSGFINFDEFCGGLLRLQGDAKSFDIHCLIFEQEKFIARW